MTMEERLLLLEDMRKAIATVTEAIDVLRSDSADILAALDTFRAGVQALTDDGVVPVSLLEPLRRVCTKGERTLNAIETLYEEMGEEDIDAIEADLRGENE
jgi:hypothetical protein